MQLSTGVRRLLEENCGGIILLEGEAGLGKTRLLEEFKGSDLAGMQGLASLRDLLVLSGKGDASRSGQVSPFSRHTLVLLHVLCTTEP